MNIALFVVQYDGIHNQVLLSSIRVMWQLLAKLTFWAADVTLLSSILALVEIVIEKDQGWASALNQRGWGRKLLTGTPVVRWIDKPYVTSYHLLVFGTILPVVLWTQDRTGVLTAFGSASRTTHPVANALLFVSIFLAVCVLEDFLWFALNWHYPGSLDDLLAGKVWWHTRWITFSPSLKLPRFYLAIGFLAVLLLVAGVAL